MKRRAFIAALVGAAAWPVVGQAQQPAQPRPFRVDIPQAKIDRILTRVREAEWPERRDEKGLPRRVRKQANRRLWQR